MGLLGSAWGGCAGPEGLGVAEEEGSGPPVGRRQQHVLALAKISLLLKTELGERCPALKKKVALFLNLRTT